MSGAILWFTGLSSSGKSTLGAAVAAHLKAFGPVEVLDGDEVRKHLSKGLTFTKEDRGINVRRIGFVARLLARHGVFVIVAAISPYAEARDEMRELATAEGVPFLEVFLTADLQSLMNRDVKGLYKRALAGDIPNFSGISDPYEAPVNPELVLYTDAETADVSARRILDMLVDRGLVATVMSDRRS